MQWTEKKRKKQTASLRIVRYIGGRADRKEQYRAAVRKEAQRESRMEPRRPAVQQKEAQRRSRKEQYRAAGRKEVHRGGRKELQRPGGQTKARCEGRRTAL